MNTINSLITTPLSYIYNTTSSLLNRAWNLGKSDGPRAKAVSNTETQAYYQKQLSERHFVFFEADNWLGVDFNPIVKLLEDKGDASLNPRHDGTDSYAEGTKRLECQVFSNNGTDYKVLEKDKCSNHVKHTVNDSIIEDVGVQAIMKAVYGMIHPDDREKTYEATINLFNQKNAQHGELPYHTDMQIDYVFVLVLACNLKGAELKIKDMAKKTGCCRRSNENIKPSIPGNGYLLDQSRGRILHARGAWNHEAHDTDPARRMTLRILLQEQKN